MRYAPDGTPFPPGFDEWLPSIQARWILEHRTLKFRHPGVLVAVMAGSGVVLGLLASWWWL